MPDFKKTEGVMGHRTAREYKQYIREYMPDEPQVKRAFNQMCQAETKPTPRVDAVWACPCFELFPNDPDWMDNDHRVGEHIGLINAGRNRNGNFGTQWRDRQPILRQCVPNGPNNQQKTFKWKAISGTN